MKNIQIIDRAENCTYSIFQATNEEFDVMFPEGGQDIEYAEDLYERLDAKAAEMLSSIWERPVEKNNAVGIHGTLFIDMQYRKKYYSSKSEKSIDPMYINEAQRRLYKNS